LSPQRAAITGPVIASDNCVGARARQQRYDERYRGVCDGQKVDFMAGGNSAVWRHVFLRLGGFPLVTTMSANLFVQKLAEVHLGCHFVKDLRIRHRNHKGLKAAAANAFAAGFVSAHQNRFILSEEVARACSDVIRIRSDLQVQMVNSFLHWCFIGGGISRRLGLITVNGKLMYYLKRWCADAGGD
jgi:hypothetical protein